MCKRDSGGRTAWGRGMWRPRLGRLGVLLGLGKPAGSQAPHLDLGPFCSCIWWLMEAGETRGFRMEQPEMRGQDGAQEFRPLVSALERQVQAAVCTLAMTSITPPTRSNHRVTHPGRDELPQRTLLSWCQGRKAGQ